MKRKSKGYHHSHGKGTLKKQNIFALLFNMPKIYQFSRMQIIVYVFLLISIGIAATAGWYVYHQNQIAYLNGSNIIYKINDVLGISTDTASVSIDFGRQIASGSPMIFGGAHNPRLDHKDAWDKISAAGITSIRSDFFMESYIPSNITLADYIKNVNDVQNPMMWNKSKIYEKNSIYINAKNRNMKVIAILAYLPKWLTYTGTIYGVPKDWNVFKDLVKKSYSLHRNYINVLEIWNEPDTDFFLNITGSGLTREQAYKNIVKYATEAITEVDNEKNDGRKVQICIPALADPRNISTLQSVLSDSTLRSVISCVSYHNYEHIPEPSFTRVKQILKQNNVLNMPIYITEWAHSPKMKTQDQAVIGEAAITYASLKLASYLNYGVSGANYFQLKPIETNSPRGDEGYLGFYYWDGKSATLLPVSKTFALFSKSLGLGNGKSQIYYVTQNNITGAVGFTNYNGNRGIILTNDSGTDKTVEVSLLNFIIDRKITVKAFGASAIYDGKKQLGTNFLKTTDKKLKVLVPKMSVIGVLIENL